uniref:L-type lectin-like domain-containing protein n=1 Tax=Periophthalmus magnuspinnatus TaxID=409849 RepID=A0A3B4B1J4_9GOBI
MRSHRNVRGIQFTFKVYSGRASWASCVFAPRLQVSERRKSGVDAATNMENGGQPCCGRVGSQWDFWGSTLVTSSYVRLTPDERSKQGSIWNTVVSVYSLLYA